MSPCKSLIKNKDCSKLYDRHKMSHCSFKKISYLPNFGNHLLCFSNFEAVRQWVGTWEPTLWFEFWKITTLAFFLWISTFIVSALTRSRNLLFKMDMFVLISFKFRRSILKSLFFQFSLCFDFRFRPLEVKLRLSLAVSNSVLSLRFPARQRRSVVIMMVIIRL